MDALASLIGHYTELLVLHQGRHSTVWSARDANGATVVIKAYYKQKMKVRHARHVVRETRLLQVFRDCSCRGVVRLQEAFEDEQCVFLIFEPCMKGDLFQLMMKHNGTLEEGFVACHVIAPLLSTLALLHALNIVHRDVKTENVFLASNGEVQLGDFGLVAHKLHDALVDRVGTLDYMAPEVLSMPTTDDDGEDGSHGCRQPYDEKVDIWAVGVLLYELLVGRPPFEVEDPRETARLILEAQPPAYPPHLPPDCVDFISAAMQARPGARPSAAQLRDHPWLQRHMRAARPNSPAQLASREVHEAVDVAVIRQSIYDAWKTDELEQSMNMMNLTDAAEPPGDVAMAMDMMCCGAAEASAPGPAAQQQHPQLQPPPLQQQQLSNGKTRSRTPSGSGAYISAVHTPSSHHASCVEAAGQLAAASPRTAAQAAEVKKYRSMSHSCYTVLGKALALSVGRGSGSGHTSPTGGHGPRDGVEESSRSFAGTSPFDPSELIAAASSQSFTSSACGRMSTPERDALQVWQRSIAPQKPAGKGRSRFAS